MSTSSRVAPSNHNKDTPIASAGADDGQACSGPPAEGRYGHQRYFGEESCFALVICWPASPLVGPLLMFCGLDTRTVWMGADGTIWEVCPAGSNRRGAHRPPCAHARASWPCIALTSPSLPSASSARMRLGLHLPFPSPSDPLARAATTIPFDCGAPPHVRCRDNGSRRALSCPTARPPQSADPGAKRITSRFDVSNFGRGHRYESGGRVRPRPTMDPTSEGPNGDAAAVPTGPTPATMET